MVYLGKYMLKNADLKKPFSDPSLYVCDLQLCEIFVEDNSLYPWVVLVPKRENVKEMIDLNKNDQYLLMDEIEFVSKAMQKAFSPDKLNIAAFGNIVPQLHIHIIARYKSDNSWPSSVFNKDSLKYSDENKRRIVNVIKQFLIS